MGHEIRGKKLGVIGLGAIGGLVANDAYNLGMEVLGFDTHLPWMRHGGFPARYKKQRAGSRYLPSAM